MLRIDVRDEIRVRDLASRTVGRWGIAAEAALPQDFTMRQPSTAHCSRSRADRPFQLQEFSPLFSRRQFVPPVDEFDRRIDASSRLDLASRSAALGGIAGTPDTGG